MGFALNFDQVLFSAIERDEYLDAQPKAASYQIIFGRPRRCSDYSNNESSFEQDLSKGEGPADKECIVDNHSSDEVQSNVDEQLEELDDPFFDIFERPISGIASQDDCVNFMCNPKLFKCAARSKWAARSARAAIKFQTGLALTREAMRVPSHLPHHE